MRCYQDRAWCDLYKACAKGEGCDRALTPEVRERADKWALREFNTKEAPICVMDFSKLCFEKKKEKK